MSKMPYHTIRRDLSALINLFFRPTYRIDKVGVIHWLKQLSLRPSSIVELHLMFGKTKMPKIAMKIDLRSYSISIVALATGYITSIQVQVSKYIVFCF